MEYQEFLEEVADNIKNYLPVRFKDAEVTIGSSLKNNDIVLNSICIKQPEEAVAPVIYMENYYEKFQEGELNVDDVCRLVSENRLRAERQIDAEKLIESDYIKDNVFYRLVGAESNKEILANCPHKLYQDMAITYHVSVFNEMEGEVASYRVSNELLDKFDMNIEDIHELALKNTPELFPAQFRNMAQVLGEMFGVTPEEMEFPEAPMYVLSNTSNINGASVLLYPGIQEEIFQKLQSEYFVLPSSIHETIILPKEPHMSESELKEMVNQVNSTEVSPEEVLTGNVYEYDARAKVLTIAGEPLYKANIVDIKRSGYSLTRNLEKNMESLNKATGRNNTLKDVKEILTSDQSTDIEKEIATDIANECKAQELQRMVPEL